MSRHRAIILTVVPSMFLGVLAGLIFDPGWVASRPLRRRAVHSNHRFHDRALRRPKCGDGDDRCHHATRRPFALRLPGSLTHDVGTRPGGLSSRS